MKTDILLNENRSKSSANASNSISVDLDAKVRLLPYGDLQDTLSLYSLYNDERDACTKYRLIFTLYPICTNVLYNSKTETVRNEGTNNCISLIDSNSSERGNCINTTALSQIQSVRDTEYSHPMNFIDGVPYVYHCGYDIFNNHMLRANEFTSVQKINVNSNDAAIIESKKNYNTITDYLRDNNGDVVKEKITYTEVEKYNDETNMHLYRYDSILTMYNSFYNRLKEENGWFGFTNSGNIEITNDSGFSVNRIMNNNKPCEFIDLYPDRSLFSFIPKVNKYRKRLEYNWEYCIMYPYSNNEDKLYDVIGIGDDRGDMTTPGVGIVGVELTHTNSGNEIVRFKSMFKHTLTENSYIRLYYKTADGAPVKFGNKLKVFSVGDESNNDTNKLFSVRFSELSATFAFDENGNFVINDGNNTPVRLFYKKDADGYECKYYFRVFKEIKHGLKSEVNKLAYGETIYGDRMAQIVVTDDIDINGFVDNIGRPLTKLYLAVYKTNKGYEKWYGTNSEYKKGSDIEFSHCFGKVTSGLDLPKECFDYNVRRLHNIDLTDVKNEYKHGTELLFGDALSAIPKTIESNIVYDSDNSGNTIIGDLVEFDVNDFEERVIEPVYFRFNTAQRECASNPKYYDIYDDEIRHDDYDKGINMDSDIPTTGSSFMVTSGRINQITVDEDGVENTYLFAGNLNPEGYYYNPLHEIKIKELDTVTSSVAGKNVNYSAVSVTYGYISGPYETSTSSSKSLDGVNYAIIRFLNNSSVKFALGDIVALYDNIHDSYYHTKVFDISDREITIVCDRNFVDENAFMTYKYNLVYCSEQIPEYAKYLRNGNRFVWRSELSPSIIPNDSSLYNIPFSNGAFYIHSNMNFFLKRQDPEGEFNLLNPDINEKYASPTRVYKMNGWVKIDLSFFDFIDNMFNGICY